MNFRISHHIYKTSLKSTYSYFHETTFPILGHHWENLPRLIPIFPKHPPKVPIPISTKLLPSIRDIIGKIFRDGFPKHPPKVPIPISTKLPSPFWDIIGKTFHSGFPKHPSKVPIPISTKLLSPFCTHLCKIFANFLRTLLADHNALVYIS